MPANSKPRWHWLIPMAMWAFLLATAVFSKPFRYGALSLLALAGLYVLFALVLYLPALLALRRGLLPALVVAAPAAFVLALHLREQTRPSGTAESLDKPEVLASFAIAWAVIVLLYLAALWLLGPRDTEAPAGIMLVAVVPLLLAALMLSFHGSNTLRWHLLRHNVLLGALSHHLFARDTATVRAELWERNAGRVPPPVDVPVADPGAGGATSPEDPSEDLSDPSTTAAAERDGPGVPDVVFVLIDTLRSDALAATGGAGGAMPYLDGLARDAFVFTDVKANSSWTLPSVASFFTGLLPEEHGAVWQSTLGEGQVTLAETLAARGYRTAAFIANAAWMRAERGMAQGFEAFHQLGTGGAVYPRAEEVNAALFEWLDGLDELQDALATGAAPPAPDDQGAAAGTGGNAGSPQAAGRSQAPEAVADAAPLSGEAAPLFLYVHYMDPHVPYLAAGVVDPASNVEARAAYEAELGYLDAHLAELMDGLAARRARPTWTLITADHGEEFGEHGERGHGRVLYDEALRVPALLHRREGAQEGEGARGGGSGTSGVVDAPLEGRDFFSLLVDLAAPGSHDVAAWARTHARDERYASTYYTNTSLVYRLLRPYRAVICLQAIEKDGYTLIWSGQGNTWELYDLRSDPAQLHNIADAQPDVVNRLAAAMRAAPEYWTPEVRGTLDAEALERLRSLGYLR